MALSRLPGALASAAAARNLDLGCAVELCLERALVVRDLADVGLLATYPRLLEFAGSARVERALPPSKSRYLQMLLAALDRPTPLDRDGDATDAVIDVPVRLFPRVLDLGDGSPLGACELDEALRLEVAAASNGRPMSEWAAVAALRLSP
jgi:hypothetical protein